MTTDQNSEQPLGKPSYRQHPAFSNSDFIHAYSPFILKKVKNGEIEFDEKDYHIMGRAFETYLIKPASFNDEFYVAPDMYESPSSPNQHQFVNILANYDELEDYEELIYRAYRESYKVSDKDLESGKYKKPAQELADKLALHLTVLQSEKPVITQSVFDTIKVMVYNTLSNPFWVQTIKNEDFHVLFGVQLGTDNPLTLHEVPVKGELDCLLFNKDFTKLFIIDFKTTTVAITEFPKKLIDYNYPRQIVFYSHLVKLDLQSPNSTIKKLLEAKYNISLKGVSFDKISGSAYILAVEKKYENHAKFFPITQNLYTVGAEQIVENLTKIKFYIEHNFEKYAEESEPGIFKVNYNQWLS